MTMFVGGLRNTWEAVRPVMPGVSSTRSVERGKLRCLDFRQVGRKRQSFSSGRAPPPGCHEKLFQLLLETHNTSRSVGCEWRGWCNVSGMCVFMDTATNVGCLSDNQSVRSHQKDGAQRRPEEHHAACMCLRGSPKKTWSSRPPRNSIEEEVFGIATKFIVVHLELVVIMFLWDGQFLCHSLSESLVSRHALSLPWSSVSDWACSCRACVSFPHSLD